MVNKIKGSLAIFSILLILVIGIGMVSASDDALLSVNESSAVLQANETTVEGHNFEDIQYAIDEVDIGGTVTLKESMYISAKPTEYKPIYILKPVTVVGVDSQSMLDAQTNTNLIEITNANDVVIKNIKFTGVTQGSAVRIDNSNVTFINCNFESNSGGLGAAIDILSQEKSDVVTNIINCTFSYNYAKGIGGAIFIDQDQSSFTTNIYGSAFQNNVAGRGGAIYVGSDNSRRGFLTVKNSSFAYNDVETQEESAEWAGADISLSDDIDKYQVEIVNSNFTNNMISGDIDKIPARSLVLTNDANILLNNSFRNSTVYFNKTKARIEGCSFDSSAIAQYANFNYQDDMPTSENIRLDISDSVFRDSSVTIGQGKISDSRFINSNVDKDTDKDFTITGSRFSDCSYVFATNDVSIINSEFDEAHFETMGYANLTVDNSTFKNHIAIEGAAIRFNKDSYSTDMAILTVTNSRFINNTARYWGGAISTCKDVYLTISDSIFINNSARNGGAIFADQSEGIISNCIFEGNVAANRDNETTDYLNKHYKSTGSPIDIVFKYYLDLYDKDIPNWKNEYYFPQYQYGNQILSSDSRVAYFGSAVFAHNLLLENNYWGLNLKDRNDLYVGRIINPSNTMVPAIWVNCIDGSFVLSDNGTVEMPDYVPVSPDKKEVVVTVTQHGNELRKSNITVNVVDALTNEAIANQEVLIVLSHGMYLPLVTDENGTAVYEVAENIGSYYVSTTVEIPGYRAVEVISNATIVPQKINVKASSLSTTYNSGKKLTITVLDSENKTLGIPVHLQLKVFTGNTPKLYFVSTNAKGIAYFTPATKVAVGTHKVEITSSDGEFEFSKVTTTIKISKAKTTIKAPKVTAKYRKSKYFKVTVKNSATKKVVTNTKVKIKVYTGKKTKTYTVKTNSKGIAQINTKSLSYGKHKVVISSGNSNYVMSAKSTITIKW